MSPLIAGEAVAMAVENLPLADDVACLETDRVAFYERLGWEEWCGSLGGRSGEDFIPTPDQSGIMILRLARTPNLDLRQLLTIEAHPARSGEPHRRPI